MFAKPWSAAVLCAVAGAEAQSTDPAELLRQAARAYRPEVFVDDVDPQTPAWEAAHLATNRRALELLDAALASGEPCRFDGTRPDLDGLSGLNTLLCMQARAQLRAGDPAGALATARSLLRLGAETRREGDLHAGLQASAFVKSALHVAEEALAADPALAPRVRELPAPAREVSDLFAGEARTLAAHVAPEQQAPFARARELWASVEALPQDLVGDRVDALAERESMQVAYVLQELASHLARHRDLHARHTRLLEAAAPR